MQRLLDFSTHLILQMGESFCQTLSTCGAKQSIIWSAQCPGAQGLTQMPQGRKGPKDPKYAISLYLSKCHGRQQSLPRVCASRSRAGSPACPRASLGVLLTQGHRARPQGLTRCWVLRDQAHRCCQGGGACTGPSLTPSAASSSALPSLFSVPFFSSSRTTRMIHHCCLWNHPRRRPPRPPTPRP